MLPQNVVDSSSMRELEVKSLDKALRTMDNQRAGIKYGQTTETSPQCIYHHKSRLNFTCGRTGVIVCTRTASAREGKDGKEREMWSREKGK